MHWIKLTDRMPNPDEHGRVLIYTEAPFTCKYCGMPSWIDPSDQSPPPDYCHEIDHGTAEDRAVFGHHSAEP